MKRNRFCKHLLAVLLIAASVCEGCSKTPQIAGSEDCMAAADALWTAVTAKQPALLEKSAEEIQRLRAANKMQADACDALSQIVATARTGDWSGARVSLKAFVKAQRPVPH